MDSFSCSTLGIARYSPTDGGGERGKKGDRSHTAQQGAAAAEERELPERREKLFKKIGNVATKVHFRTRKSEANVGRRETNVSIMDIGYVFGSIDYKYSERVILALESCLERGNEVKGSKDKKGRT